MSIPKVKFSIAPINYYFPIIHSFLNPSKDQWDWSDIFYKEFPKLKNELKDIKGKTKRRQIELKFFNIVFKKEKKKLEKKNESFQRAWDKINDDFMNILIDVVEINWPKRDKVFNAKLTLNPICPRWIKQREFHVYYKYSNARMKATTMHEILHFIYFEKWKEVFPKIKEREFDTPYLVWQLSEMVPGIILNDKRIQKVFKHKNRPYEVYEKLKIGGKPLLSYLQGFYDNRKDFADFLEKSWKFVKKYEKEINS